MNPDVPPAAPSPSDLPPQRPPIEVQAEPVRPDERGRVFDAPPPPPSAPPPPRGPSSGPTSSAPPGGGGSAYTPPPSGASAPAPRGTGWAVACHLLALIDIGVSFILVGFIATLVVWLLKKDEDAEVAYHGRESLNFQLNLFFWWIAGAPLLLCCGLGALIWAALPFIKIALMLIASVKTANGERWSYPFIYRVLR